MDTDRLNSWLTLGANVGVLVGLFILVLEIQQNRDLAAASLRNDISRQSVELQRTSASEIYGPILYKTIVGEELTPYEDYIYSTFMTSALEFAENIYFQHQSGLFGTDSEINSVRAQLAFRLQNEFNLAFYQSYRSMLTPEFVRYVDQIIEEQ